jgi:hypothetical protein
MSSSSLSAPAVLDQRQGRAIRGRYSRPLLDLFATAAHEGRRHAALDKILSPAQGTGEYAHEREQEDVDDYS